MESEYINALQDEIKFMEYELKLLKDKEMEQVQGLAQVDTFFSDGISLNSNILSIKNMYKMTKSEAEEKLKVLSKLNLRNSMNISM